MPALVAAALREHRERQRAERVAAGDAWSETGLVFTTATGRHVEPRNLNTTFRSVVARAGVRPIRFHDQCWYAAGDSNPEPARIKRFRCPILTGPVRRRQSHWRRSVHGSRAETSIRCSPVRGARAPIEHPNPASSTFMSLVDALTESQGVRNRPTTNRSRHRQPPPTACRLTKANNVPEHPSITHRQLAIPDRPCCRRHAMPADWRARVLGQRHTPSPPAAATFRGARHHSLIWHLPTHRLSMSDSVQVGRPRPIDASPTRSTRDLSKAEPSSAIRPASAAPWPASPAGSPTLPLVQISRSQSSMMGGSGGPLVSHASRASTSGPTCWRERGKVRLLVNSNPAVAALACRA
jgi:hypothetical protein